MSTNNKKKEKLFFRWADPACQGVNPVWIQITGVEFYRFMQAEGKHRYFMQINDGEDDGMTVYVMETTRQGYLKWHCENQRKYDQRKKKIEKGIIFHSLDDEINNEPFLFFCRSLIDDASDPIADIEDKEDIRILQKAIDTLPEEDRELLRLLFLENDLGLSDQQVGEILGLKQTTFSSRKRKIFEKIRNFFAET